MPKANKYTKELLKSCIVRDEAILVGNYDTVNRNTKISFTCKCGTPGNKVFRNLFENGGAYCKECTNKNYIKKCNTTNLDRYGIKYPLQRKEIMDKVIKTNIEKYEVEFVTQNITIRNKAMTTNLKKYGTENTIQSDVIKDKIKKTNLEKYGAENPFQSDVIKDKIKKTNLEKYGVENPFQSDVIKDKIKIINLKKYGVEYTSQRVEIQEKIKLHNIKKYGVEYPSQAIEIQEKIQKNSKKYKQYIMPSGTIRNVQGYEPFALDRLLKIYTEEQIKTERTEIGGFPYNIDGKIKYYFPDISIPHENKIIEVKSSWTYKIDTEKIKLNTEAIKIKGYTYEIWVFDKKGNCEVITP
jgi:hypothetical protein